MSEQWIMSPRSMTGFLSTPHLKHEGYCPTRLPVRKPPCEPPMTPTLSLSTIPTRCMDHSINHRNTSDWQPAYFDDGCFHTQAKLQCASPSELDPQYMQQVCYYCPVQAHAWSPTRCVRFTPCMYPSAACPCQELQDFNKLMQTDTCSNGSLQARHTVQNVIGGNVARQGLD